MCNKNSWACLCQWHGLSSVMKRPIESVFPERVPDNLRKTLTYYIQPRQLSSQSPLHFLWSKSGITEGHFIPNHFVPLVSRTEMQISEGAVFLIFLFLLQLTKQQQFMSFFMIRINEEKGLVSLLLQTYRSQG